MGTFRAAIEIGDPQGQRWQAVEALVDTGASYTWVPAIMLAELGVRPQFRREFVTADNRVVECDMAVTVARWDGQALPTLVVFGEDGSVPLLGAYTLEGFGLAPDPVNRRLIRVRGLAVRAGQASGSPTEPDLLDWQGNKHQIHALRHLLSRRRHKGDAYGANRARNRRSVDC